MDIRMRRALGSEFARIWQATVQTVWDDLPSDERSRLDREAWEKHIRKRLGPYVESDRTEAWVADGPDGIFLGYILLGPGGGFLTQENHAFVFDVWVSPEHRGKGLGTYLLSWAADWARGKGYRRIKLEVAETNARARHLYEAAGFRPERTYMGKPIDSDLGQPQSRETRTKR